MKLLYFAWVRQRVGMAEETVELPDAVATVGDLLAWLETRGPSYAEALGAKGVVKVAVNQEYAGSDRRLAPGDEVALFPPVTGG
ncbi:MAG: molybdopterin converting factor subunit 1 [Proteobacteria bacterium]|nr:molybdopterin converting factor subunit 1 [Pseudomonadota bacterium]MBI3496304.1 molybdopterin converting factor subunit 1 [Pseudomonadota bacterium]